MTDFETHPIGTQDNLDLLREVYEAAKSYRQLDQMTGTPISRDSRHKSEALLDLAILNYQELEAGD